MNWNNLIQLYGYQMFDNIRLNPGINKEVLINSIMDKCALATPLFPELELLTAKVNNFFLKYEETINRLYTAYMTEYNMIENYDRIEEHMEQYSGNNVSQVSPYDTNSFVNDSQNVNENTRTINSRTHGNIGVTTASAMLRESIELLPRLNIYENIANMFYSELCLYVC